jgi:hypothetical protein
VIVSGIVLAQYAVDDRMAEAYAMVSLVEQGWADQDDVARAFARAARTLRRYQRRVEAGGLAALGRPHGYPAGRPRVKSARLRLVARLKGEGLSNRVIAHRLGVSEKAVRKLLGRLGWRPATGEQKALPLPSMPADPNLSAFPVAPPPAGPAEPPPAPPAQAGEAVAGADPNLSAVDSGPDPDDLPVRFLGGKLRLRQVTRRSEDGHQTPILTSRRDLSAFEVAARMFGRWRQASSRTTTTNPPDSPSLSRPTMRALVDAPS